MSSLGVVTNLVGGYLGARFGLNRTMNIGLGLQILALTMLLVPAAWLTVAWVMVAQAISGIAKDLNKMSAKSTIKLLVPDQQQGQLLSLGGDFNGLQEHLKRRRFLPRWTAINLTWLPRRGIGDGTDVVCGLDG